MTEARKIPSQLNVNEMSVEALLDGIAEQREIQREGKFMEGIFKQALEAKRDPAKNSVESPTRVGVYSTVNQERLDNDKIRSEVSRDDLLAKGWLAVTSYVKLDIKKK